MLKQNRQLNRDERRPLMGIRVGASFIRIVRSRRPDQVVYLVKFPIEPGNIKRRCKGFFSLETAVTFARKVAAELHAHSTATTNPDAPVEIGLSDQEPVIITKNKLKSRSVALVSRRHEPKLGTAAHSAQLPA